MGKRTSDFVALAAILGGAGLGYGLTSLFAQSRTDFVAQADDVSVEVQVMQSRVILTDASVAPSIYVRGAGANGPDWEPLLLLMADMEAALEKVEALEDLDLGQYLTSDILQSEEDEDEDQRRRRRRRRPRQ